MRQLTAAAVLASACLLAACGGSKSEKPTEGGKSSAPPTTSAAPVAEAALDGLLLSADQINTIMAANGMTVNGSTYIVMGDDTTRVSDVNCLAVAEPGEGPVYTGSGWTATRAQLLRPVEKLEENDVLQAVVLFPAAADAAAFFTTSTNQWNSCSNRQYDFTDEGKPPTTWSVGAVSNTDGVLSARRTEEGGNGWSCQRALTVRNNVAVDVSACSPAEGDFGVNIARQIADKVARL